jgi:hypothetical protein
MVIAHFYRDWREPEARNLWEADKWYDLEVLFASDARHPLAKHFPSSTLSAGSLQKLAG